MRPPKRWRTAVLATIALATAAVVGARDGNSPTFAPAPRQAAAGDLPPEEPKREAQIDRLATSGVASPSAAVELDGLPPAGFIAREQPRALAVARRFLDGYLAFEVREGGAAAAHQVAQTAAPGLAADLLAGGAQLPAAMDRLPPRAEIYAIDLEFDKPPTAAQVRAEVKRGSDRSDIAVIVERKETRWVVTQVIE